MADAKGATATAPTRQRGTPWPLWRRQRLPWLLAALACAMAAVVAALLLPVTPNPWQGEGGIASRDFWLAPVERNGFLRMPVLSAGLGSVAVFADGKTALAVGGDGTILRSVDAGENWTAKPSGTTSILTSVAVSADGNTALAVTWNGTILRSVDAGENWTAKPSGTTSILTSVAVSADGKTALVVGDDGTILRSADAGETWTPKKSGTKAALFSVAVLADGKTALAVAGERTILRSADAGETWTPKTPGTTGFLNSVAVLGDGKTALAVGGNGTILRSADAGETWTPKTSGTRETLSSLAVSADGKTALAVGYDGTILRSADAGGTWTPKTSGTTASLSSLAVLADGKTALAVGGRTILRSADAGESWAPKTSGMAAFLNSVAVLADGKTALAVGGDGTILRSVDAGETWTPKAAGVTAELNAAAVFVDGKTALAVGKAGTILRSADAGETWTAKTASTASPLSVAVLADGKTALAVGFDGTILRSADVGETWSPKAGGTTASLFSIAALADGKTALAVGAGGTILRSADAGESWTPKASGTREFLYSVAVLADGKTALAVGDAGIIQRSADAGETWIRKTAGTTPRLNSVAVFADGKTALAVESSGNILRSADAGETWTPKTASTTASLHSVAVLADGKTALAVGTDGTILRSTDAGETWQNPLAPYRRGAPRVAWVFLVAGFLTVLPGFARLSPPPAPPVRMAELLATDRPLRRTDRDVAGAGDLAGQIGRFLRHAQTAAPITIAVTGEWGSGKSSVLSRLRDALEANGQRPVWFNAWHRQGEESLFAALLQAVRDKAVPEWWSLAGLEVRLRLLLGRIRTRFVSWSLALLLVPGLAAFLAAADWPSPLKTLGALKQLTQEKDKIAEAGLRLLLGLSPVLAILVGGLILFAALRDRLTAAGLDPGRLIAAAGRATRWRDLGVQLAFRDRFKTALSEVTAALGSRTLTILIDDLDRCRPDQIAEVLEAINFLTDGDGCFVVLAYARRQVLAGVGLAHRQIAAELNGGEDTLQNRQSYAEDYLRKLVQIEVPVPQFHRDAPARLVHAAVDGPQHSPPARVWLPPLAGFGLLVCVGIGLWGGQGLWDYARAAWQAAPIEKPATALPEPPIPAPLPPPPIQGPAPKPEPTRETGSGVFSPGQSSPPPYWMALLLAPFIALAGLAVALAARRPRQISDLDTPGLTVALGHWAEAAYAVRRSPREMKRFLNRLRFAAAGTSELPGDVLVGLAVLGHAAGDDWLSAALANGPDGLHGAIDGLTNDVPGAALIRAALDPDSLDHAGLPRFAPDQAQLRIFLALWKGVTVEG